MRRLAALLGLWGLPGLLAIAGCATPLATTPDIGTLTGRLSLQVEAHADRPAQSLSAAFELRGDAQRGELRLNTPLGTTLAAAGWGPSEATLNTPQGQTRYTDLDALSFAVFGETLPLRALPDWLKGQAWAGAAEPAVPLLPGPGFMQLGWRIDLARFGDGQVLAGRAGPPAVRLRAQMDAAP